MFRLVYKKNILTSPKVKIKNIKNIKFHKNSNLIVGLSNVNHVNNNSICYINNRGEMHVSGNVFIAKSVRVDIADSSKIILNDCYIGPETDLISYSGISIGKGSMVSWRVQFLDEDFHLVSYNDKKPKEGANKQVISSQADSLIKISRIWADFFPANTSNQPI